MDPGQEMVKSPLRPVDLSTMRGRRWCTQAEAAHRMGVTPSAVRRLVATGALPAVQVDGQVRLEVAEVERYAHRRRRCGIR